MLYINPVKKSIQVTPDDTDPLVDPADSNAAITSRAISVGVAGNVAFEDDQGNARLAVNLAAGILHPIMTKKILATGTTATGVVAYW